MTHEEALKLKPGDVVKTYINGKDRVAFATHVYEAVNGEIYVICRRAGKTDSGGRFPQVDRHCGMVERSTLDAIAANIYADYLDERGFTDAATCLRQEFPLVDGKVP